MRKLYIVILAFLSIFVVSIKAYAKSFHFEWENTTVNVTVGTSIEEYRYIPKAKLYVDGEYKSDAKISYLTDGAWLYYMTDVDTSKVGEYEVWYKASEEKYKPGTCPGYKSLIKFVVRDDIKPTINIIDDIVYVRRGDTYDLDNNVITSDNYSKNINVKYSHQINFNEIGSYKVNVIATDEAGNYQSDTFTVEVIDGGDPKITFLGEKDLIKLSLNSEVEIKSYFSAYDPVDKDISANIHYPYFDTSTVGDSLYTVTVENNIGKTTSYTVTLRIVDDVEPVITFSEDNLEFDYAVDIDEINFSKYISIEDNEKFDENRLTISHNIKNIAGLYTVTYTYSDSNFTVEKDLSVRLISTIAPAISTSNIKLDTDFSGSLIDYIIVTDDSDPYIILSVEIDDSSVSYGTAGTYQISVYAINSSGVASLEYIDVIISDSSSSDIDYFQIIYIIVSLLIIIPLIVTIVVIIIKRKKAFKKG